MAYIKKSKSVLGICLLAAPDKKKKVTEKLVGLNCPVYLPLVNKAFASGQAIRVASNAVLRPTEHGSERAGRQNVVYMDSSQAEGGVSNPQDE